MHAISSYSGNRPTNTPTHKHTNRQDRLQYTAPQLARSVINNWLAKEWSLYRPTTNVLRSKTKQKEKFVFIPR